tara:strand:- start:1531 stop:2250 length:720 start_codon:yes stop_codon:yes gene_type:complete
MRNLDRKSMFIGLLIPIAAILFMGAVKNVLSRYHTIQAEEFQLVDGEGNAIFNLSEMLTAGADDEESAVDYGPMIANLNSGMMQLERSLKDIESNDDFVSLDIFTKNLQSMNKKIENLSMKCETEFKSMASLKKSCESDKKSCNSGASKDCCKNKQPQVVKPSATPSNDENTDSEVAELRSELESLTNACANNTAADSESDSRMSQEILDLRSELQLISENQEILMKILRKDIKKLKKK